MVRDCHRSLGDASCQKGDRGDQIASKYPDIAVDVGHAGKARKAQAIAAGNGAGCELLAVLSAEAVEDGNLHLGSLEGPRLQVLTLPYELDRDREIQR